MFRSRRFITLRGIVVAAIGVMFIVLVWYLSTHGYASIENYTPGKNITFQQLSSNLSSAITSSNSDSTLLTSGKYTVGVPTKNGIQVVEASVPRFLGSTSILANRPTPFVETIGRNALSNIVSRNGSLVTHSGSLFRPIDRTNITNDDLNDKNARNYPEFVASAQLNKQLIAGIVQTSAGVQPATYNVSSESIVSYPLLSKLEATEAFINNAGGIFSLFDMENGRIYIYGSSAEDVTEVSIANVDNVSTKDGSPSYSATNTRLAIVAGPDLVGSGDDEADIKDSEFRVSVTDLASRQVLRTFTFPSSVLIAGVTLSPNSDRIAIRALGSTGIYSIETGEQLFQIPFSTPSFRWINNEEYAFVTQTNGIFIGSLTKKAAQTIAFYGDIRPTELSFAEGNILYFTGYSGAIQNAQNPDSYRADISKTADEASLNVLRKFPYQGNGFYIDCLDSTITVQLTRYNGKIDERAKAGAQRYINSVIGDSSRYKIRYSYITLNF